MEYIIPCRFIRVGSYKIFPSSFNRRYLTVYLTPDSIKFCAPNVSGFPLYKIVMKCNDMRRMIWCLEESTALFILPKDSFAEKVRDSLGIDKTCFSFDPIKKDPRSLLITFDIRFLTQEQISFIRYHYLPIDTCYETNEQRCIQSMLMTAPVLTSECLSDEDPRTVWKEGTGIGLSTEIVKATPYCSKSRAGELPITNMDIACLNNGNWLNDNIINFYLEYMYSKDLTKSEREKTHLFNTFFYTRLTQKDPAATKEERHHLVKTWTKKVDLFSKDYIVIPVNADKHWYLVIACFPSNVTEGGNQSSESMVENSVSDSNSNGSQRQGMPCICIFNSIYNQEKDERAGKIVRDYLEMEYFTKKNVKKSFESMKVFAMCCPQQPNLYDCGVYLLKNFECFFKDPAMRLDDPMPNLKDWYHPACILRKRQEIHKIIFDFQQQYREIN